MDEKALSSLPLPQLLGRFADDNPTPGGGSAAALAGALAASLTSMVAALSMRKPETPEIGQSLVEPVGILLPQSMGHIRRDADELRSFLMDAIDRDSAAYDVVRMAYGMPKTTDHDKAARREAIQTALKTAATTPLEVAEYSMRCADLAHRALTDGNQNAITDAAVGLLLALAGVEGALLNVAVNMDSIKDQAFVDRHRDRLRDLLTQADVLRASTWSVLRDRLKSLAD